MKNRKSLYNNLYIALSEMDKETLNKLKNTMEQYDVSADYIDSIVNKSIKHKDEKMSHAYLLLIESYKLTGDKRVNPSILELYNAEIKSKFLNKYPKNSQLTYLRIFEKSFQIEKKYGKDVFSFELSEIEELMHDLSPLTETASNVNGRIITSYIDFCIDDIGIKTVNILKNKDADWFNSFVDKNNKLYLTESDIEDIEDLCVNYQDAVIIRLLFEGVQGKALSEIRDLTKKHIDFNNNLIYLENRDTYFKPRSNKTINLLDGAMNQDDYMKNNGEMEGKEHVGLETKLVDNDYVIRASVTKTDMDNKPVDKMVIYRRIQTIADTLGYEFLTAKNIVRSGVINYAKEIYDKKGFLDKSDYLKICDRFEINNWYQLKKYCNEEIIKDMYYNKESV